MGWKFFHKRYKIVFSIAVNELDNYNYIFYDFETTGQNPCFDQAIRFAAIETDSNLEILHVHNIDIKLRNDIIPHPKALLVNRLSIDELQKGDNEYEAYQKIHKIFNKPDTISIGYNSLSFDDVFLRFGFYRNLLDPYSHQYSNKKGNNFRADLYNILFVYYLYKNDSSISWPMINNRLSLRLEKINAINNLYEGMSHDAEVDVYVTIELAKKLKASDGKIWNYLMSNFVKNNDRANFQKLSSITCINNSLYKIGILISNKLGLASNYCAPIIYLCNHKKFKDDIFVLRLDQYSFTNFTEDNFVDKIEKGIIKKKFGEPNFILPFIDQYLKPINPHFVSLAKENLDWIKHNPTAIKNLIDKQLKLRYEPLDHIDIDASLYQKQWFSNEENKLINDFHNQSDTEKVDYVDSLPNGRVKELALRIIGRNYPDMMNNNIIDYYDTYLNSIFYNKSLNVDYRGNVRARPLDLLSQTKELLKKKELDIKDQEILNSIKDFILLKTQTQQDLGF